MNAGVLILVTSHSALWMAPDGRPAAPAPVAVPQPRQAPSGPQVRPEGKTRDAFWITGMVRDATGRGLPGARVFARSLVDGGIRLYEEVRSTVTDDGGAYEIHGQAHTTA